MPFNIQTLLICICCICFGSAISEEEIVSKAGKKIVCYFTNWAAGRKGQASFSPKDIDAELCTHINYAFALLDAKTYAIVPSDPNADAKYYKQVTDLRKKGVKVLLSLGGAIDSADGKYSKLVRSKSNRDSFVKQATDYIVKNNFDGLDLDWEFPKCWNSDCSKGPTSDKPNFVKLLSELRTAFDEIRKGLLLTLVASARTEVIDQGYDLASIAKYCDFINVMTYGYYGSWSTTTGITAPLKDMKNTIQYYLDKKFPASKLVLGVAMYGASFTLKSASDNGLGAPVTKAGEPGEYTGEAGGLAFYEIINHVKKDKWKVVHKKNVGSYAYRENQWVGYDDLKDVAEKARYAKGKNLAGIMVWTLDLGLFNDKSCGGRNYPLISTAKDVINGKEVNVKNCT